jgi:hypothetical protein
MTLMQLLTPSRRLVCIFSVEAQCDAANVFDATKKGQSSAVQGCHDQTRAITHNALLNYRKLLAIETAERQTLSNVADWYEANRG